MKSQEKNLVFAELSVLQKGLLGVCANSHTLMIQHLQKFYNYFLLYCINFNQLIIFIAPNTRTICTFDGQAISLQLDCLEVVTGVVVVIVHGNIMYHQVT